MNKPDAIIFDYGNVIEGPLDEAAFAADLSALASQHGFPNGGALWQHLFVSKAWEEAKRGQIPRSVFWERQLAALGIYDEAGRYAFKRSLFRSRGIRPDMLALLHELRQRCRLAVLSNTARKGFADYLRDVRGLGGLFEIMVSSAEEGLAKPDPAIFHLTLSRLDLQPHQALFVDDLARNTQAAEAIGLRSITYRSVEALRLALAEYGVL